MQPWLNKYSIASNYHFQVLASATECMYILQATLINGADILIQDDFSQYQVFHVSVHKFDDNFANLLFKVPLFSADQDNRKI